MSDRRIMTVKEFDKLQLRDFENGAVTDEIRACLKERDHLTSPVYKGAVARKIMQSWEEWDGEAQQLASHHQCPEVWWDEMLTHLIGVLEAE